MALIEIDDFPTKSSIYGWDFPVRYVSHNQMVLMMATWIN